MVNQAAQDLAGVLLDNLDAEQVQILGPAPGVFPRLNDRYRFQILLKGHLPGQAKRWLVRVLAQLREEYRGVDVIHDVDPVSVY
jgi:primosomal protein N'